MKGPTLNTQRIFPRTMHPGGLKGRKMTPKIVIHHADLSNPQRCFVWLFKLYWELCPPNAPGDAFYLQPSHMPTLTWYSKIPLGHTQLLSTVSRLCKLAGWTSLESTNIWWWSIPVIRALKESAPIKEPLTNREKPCQIYWIMSVLRGHQPPLFLSNCWEISQY